MLFLLFSLFSLLMAGYSYSYFPCHEEAVRRRRRRRIMEEESADDSSFLYLSV